MSARSRSGRRRVPQRGGIARDARRDLAATDAAGAVFAALADPTRRRVVHELSAQGPLTATQLAERIPVSRQAIAKHFAALEEAGLATATRVGRESRYELRTEPFAEAEAWMRAIGASWDRRLEAFRRFVESAERTGAAPRRRRS